jgi:hypothetical protein
VILNRLAVDLWVFSFCLPVLVDLRGTSKTPYVT